MAAAGGEKPKFGCLDAARLAVAFAVTMLTLVVVVYTVVTVLRPTDAIVSVVNGYVSVENASSSPLAFRFTVRAASKPSSRVRIYYGDILATFSGRINGSSPPEAKDFLVCSIADFSTDQQGSSNVAVEVSGINDPNYIPPEYFNHFFHGGVIPDAMLQLNVTLTVETYSGHNDTAKPVVYCCPSVIVGGEEPEIPEDVTCTEHLVARR